MSVMPTISWARASGAALAAALVSAAAMADVGRQAGDAFDLAHPAVRAFTDRDGLPQNTVHGIAKDTLGYLWVATQDGAARWNGREWLTIDMPDRDVSNYIRTIVAARDCTLWFGREAGGLVRLKRDPLSLVLRGIANRARVGEPGHGRPASRHQRPERGPAHRHQKYTRQ